MAAPSEGAAAVRGSGRQACAGVAALILAGLAIAIRSYSISPRTIPSDQAVVSSVKAGPSPQEGSRANHPRAPAPIQATLERRAEADSIDRSSPAVTKTSRSPISPLEENRGMDHPPWLNEDGTVATSSPTDGAVQRLADEILTKTGPAALDTALSLLNASQESVGIIGAAVLVQLPDWSDDLCRKVARHKDLAVPLYSVRALMDLGRTREAEALRQGLRERADAVAEWAESASERIVPGTAWRGLIDVTADIEGEGRRAEWIAAVVSNENTDYTARMRALLELQYVVPFEEFRTLVRETCARSRDTETSVWKSGMERLAQRLEGPSEVHAGPQVLAVSDVDAMVAREYPAMYEDLALRVEVLLLREENLVGLGVSDRLRQVIGEARQTPLSEDEAYALLRIEHLTPKIKESDLAGVVPPGPPPS